MKKQKEVYDYGMRDLSVLSREELYEEVLSLQDLAVNVICKLEWVFGAFMLTLGNDFNFGMKRMRKLLGGVRRRFNTYNAFPGGVLAFDQYLEAHGYKYFFHGGKILLRDLRADKKDYFDYLSTDLRDLAKRIERGDLKDLSPREEEALKVLQEVLPLEENE